VDYFASLDTPGGTGGIKVGEIFVFKIFFQLFFESWHHLAKKIVFFFFKLKPHVPFIIIHTLKVTLSLCIAPIAQFLKISTLSSHGFETFQPEIGHCALPC
jgi:hypothetical protein